MKTIAAENITQEALQQVILNLLRNASDAMTAVEDRPRDLLIRTDRYEGDQVRLTVKDVSRFQVRSRRQTL